MAKRTTTTPASSKRVYLSQSIVPRHELDEAIRVATALVNEFGKQPTSPLNVAAALKLSPNSSHFRSICGASLAYGFTDGGPNADEIRLTELGRRAVAPTIEGDDMAAKRESLLRPQVVGTFLKRFDGSKLPRPDIASNILRELGVPKEYVDRAFGFIVNGAKSVGFIKSIKGNDYVDLSGVEAGNGRECTTEEDCIAELANGSDSTLDEAANVSGKRTSVDASREENRHVYITHGKNKALIESLKQLLMFGNFEPVVSVENETVSLPVPEKVMRDMRKCGAAIIHVEVELKLIDEDGNRQDMLNSNVLIEIGAAIALYDKRFVMLLKRGVTLPSNLQGLYVVHYDGEKLDGDTTIRLLKAINDIKNHALPSAIT